MRFVRPLLPFLAYSYPIALLLIVAGLRFGPERFWQAELALYVPRLAFALPLPVLIGLLVFPGPRRLLWTQLLAALILLFPLMGMELPSRREHPADPARTFSVLSYNGNFASGGQSALATQIRQFDPDIVVIQQLFYTDQLTRELKAYYRELQTDGEFFIASRFHIRSTTRPDSLPYRGRSRSPRFLRYVVETYVGAVALYSVHPISPRYQIAAARRGGLRSGLLTGALTSLTPRSDIESDAGLRALQVRNFSQMAARDDLPAIIAGDTNLPSLSPALGDLGAFRDGFAEAGSGFGYTFPSNRPWMRIDRIFADRRLQFLDFEVGRSQASDHLCVFARLAIN